MLLPGSGYGVQRWNTGPRVVLSFIGLLRLFLFGVVTISDFFMSAIERVTSMKMRMFNMMTKRYVTIMV